MQKLALAILFGLAIVLIWSRPKVDPSSLLSPPTQSLPAALPAQSPSASAATALSKKAATLENKDFMSTAFDVLDLKLAPNSRRKLLHQLVVTGLPAAEALLIVARTPLPLSSASPQPHSIHEMKVKFERSLRITALEALDKLAIDHPGVAAKLPEVAAEQTDPMISFLAQVSVAGIQQGRPGKLVRMIDKVVN